MARPKKEGLDYFPLDVDIDQDDKLLVIEANHGVIGFGIVVKLLMKIYKEGYFYKWSKKEQLIFSNRVNVDINSVNAIVNDCLEWDLFDKSMYEQHEILTSRGIQARYIEAVTRRKEAIFQKKYLLTDIKKHLGNSKISVFVVDEDNNKVNVNINSKLVGINDDSNPQSKVKESKVKESKEENKNSSAQSNDYTQAFESFWNVYPRKKEKKRAFGVWKTRLREGVDENLLIKCATNYKSFVEREGTEERFIKHAATFLGPSKPYEEYTEEVQQNETNRIGTGRVPQGHRGFATTGDSKPKSAADFLREARGGRNL